MKRSHKQLYEKIMRSASMLVKKALNEDIHNFDVAEYGDDEHDIIDHLTVDKLTLFSEFFKAVNNIKKLNIQGDIKHVLLPTMKIMLDVCDYKHLTNESDLEYYYDFSLVGDSLDLNEIKEFLDNNDYDFEISLIFNYDYDYYYEEFPSYSLTDIEVIYARKVIEDFISIQSLLNLYNIEKEVDNEKISVYILGEPVYDVYDGLCMMYLSDAFNNLMIYFNKYLEYLKTKLKLNEDLLKFDVAEYGDDEHDIIDHLTVDKLTLFSEFFEAVNNIKKLNIQGDIKHVLLPKMRITLDIYDAHGNLITTSNINNDYYYDFSDTKDRLNFNIVTGLLNNNTYGEYEISLNFNYDYDGYYWYQYPSLKPIEIIHARKIIKDFIKPLALRKQYNIDNLIDNKNGSVYIYGYPEEGYLHISDAFVNIMIYFNKYLEYLKTKLKLNEDLLKFDVAEYNDDETIDNQVINKCIYKYFPKYFIDLREIVEERIKENPEEPYLLDIDTSNLTVMSCIFNGKTTIKILDLSTWNTSNVTTMELMFYHCSSLEKIYFSNWNTSNVKNMKDMFGSCTSLKMIDIHKWDTSSLINAGGMFLNCKSLEILDLSEWNTSKLYNMTNMFNNCRLLRTLNLRNWEISVTNYMRTMFNQCDSLENIYTSDDRILNKFNEYKKKKLNEDLYKFDVTEYDEDPDEMIDYSTIKQVNGIENVNDTLILWSDLNIYTLEDVINDIPKSGYPIGINVLHNKYVSLKYMSTKNPENGVNTHKDIIFSNKEIDEAPNVEFHEDILLSSDKVNVLRVKLLNKKSGIYYKSIDNKKVANIFKYFDGINQTDLILNNIESYLSMHDYPAVECVYEFNPGETKKGDWYLPEIGELSYVYILKSVIEYICSILIDMGYTDIYDRIWGVWHWSSTFYNSNAVYRILMSDGRTSDMSKHFGHDTAALAMYAV